MIKKSRIDNKNGQHTQWWVKQLQLDRQSTKPKKSSYLWNQLQNCAFDREWLIKKKYDNKNIFSNVSRDQNYMGISFEYFFPYRLNMHTLTLMNHIYLYFLFCTSYAYVEIRLSETGTTVQQQCKFEWI